MATDQEIRDSGLLYVPKQKYLQDPFNLSTPPPPPPPDGGITNTNAFNNSRGNDFSVYNPDPNSIVNREYRPNYDYRRFSEYDSNPSIDDIKQMDMNQNYFYKPPPSKLQGLMSMIPGAGIARFLTNAIAPYTPVNRRSIMENELGRGGVMVNDIGQIVSGGGDYNTAANVMAGYNANKMTAKTFDDRIEMATKKMTPGEYKDKRIAALKEAKKNFLDIGDESDEIYNFEKKQKIIQREKTALGRLMNQRDRKSLAEQQINPDGPSSSRRGTPGGSADNFNGGTTYDNSGGDFRNADGSNVNQNFSTPASVSNYDPSVLYAKGGRVGYFFGGRVNYKIGGVVHPDGRKGFFKGAQADTSKGESMSPGTDASGGFRGGDNDGGNDNLLPTVDVNKKINEKINERLTGMIPDRVDKNQLLSDNAKRYQTLSKNRNSPFFMNRSNGPKTINKNLYTNNLTDLNLQYPDIKIEDEYGMIDGGKAKSLIDQAVLEQTISPVEGLNLTRSIDTTGTQSNTSGDYTIGNFNFSSPNIEEGILNSKANYNLGDLNLNANLNTNDSTINDSKLGFNYDNKALTGSTYRDKDYGYTTNKLGVDKTFDVGNNFKVGLDGSYQEDKFKDGSYYNADLTPSLTYNDGTFNARLSKEIVEGGTQPSLGIGFQKNGFYGSANNLLSQNPTSTIGYQTNIGSPDGPLQFSAGGEMDPFTGEKTAGLFGKYTFKNGGLAGLL